mgnify:CR=1 FL=1
MSYLERIYLTNKCLRRYLKDPLKNIKKIENFLFKSGYYFKELEEYEKSHIIYTLGLIDQLIGYKFNNNGDLI